MSDERGSPNRTGLLNSLFSWNETAPMAIASIRQASVWQPLVNESSHQKEDAMLSLVMGWENDL